MVLLYKCETAYSPTVESTYAKSSDGEFFEELDAFVDDATSRRLGNGSKFYGKRKSSFYGKNDKDRKEDRSIADPTGK